ncbi:hypothetical protein LE181_04050 [Streptomyces sp. SCA3-4]|uniref:hypothetical protein n=1 Tax=Streptomyces sichuanensis TaxID=2871810 RepID=UPI001CE3A30B|nr:hypothetical protein [Streptomyces sichuanensis]MCA6091343.1 hypothetical protein [Streptomyces sichuanensis]
MTTRTSPKATTRAATLAASAVLATAALLATSDTARAADGNAAATLSTGESLSPGDRLGTGDTHLVMQGDGDLVLYTAGAGGSAPQPRWRSGTTGEGNRAALRADGNLVVTAKDGGVLWESRTGGADCLHLPVTRLTVRPDGDMSILTMPNSEAPYVIRLWSATLGLQFPCGSATR